MGCSLCGTRGPIHYPSASLRSITDTSIKKVTFFTCYGANPIHRPPCLSAGAKVRSASFQIDRWEGAKERFGATICGICGPTADLQSDSDIEARVGHCVRNTIGPLGSSVEGHEVVAPRMNADDEADGSYGTMRRTLAASLEGAVSVPRSNATGPLPRIGLRAE